MRVVRSLALCALFAAGCGGATEPRMLLLVTVDTLRADELGAYGSTRGLTPNLDRLAAGSTLFTAAYAPAPFTLPSLAGLMTGQVPEALGIQTNESGLPDGVPTLASLLAEHGWQTGAVVGNFVLRRESGMAHGFDRFDDRFPDRETVRRWPERDAANTTDAALELLEGCLDAPAVPCFVWVHYQDPHGPYQPPAGWRERFLDAERSAPDGLRQLPAGEDHRGLGAIPSYQFLEEHHEVAWYRAGYRAEIAYMDEQVGRLLAALDRPMLEDATVVVFAADHGEALGDHGVWFAHGAGLTDDQVRVPLLVRAPGVAAARRDDVVTLLDVLPTVAALVGVEPVPGGRSGRDLLAPGAARAASIPYMASLGALPEAQFAVVAEGFKFISSERDGVFDGRLYALGKEDVDLGAAAPQVASRLRERLRTLRSGILPVGAPARQELGPDERERLRALGYLEKKE